MSGENKEFQMTEKMYYEMRLQEIQTTQLMFNQTCATNLKLMSENIQYLNEEVKALKQILNNNLNLKT